MSCRYRLRLDSFRRWIVCSTIEDAMQSTALSLLTKTSVCSTRRWNRSAMKQVPTIPLPLLSQICNRCINTRRRETPPCWIVPRIPRNKFKSLRSMENSAILCITIKRLWWSKYIIWLISPSLAIGRYHSKPSLEPSFRAGYFSDRVASKRNRYHSPFRSGGRFPVSTERIHLFILL